MTVNRIQRTVEFLALFFSYPDRSFFEEVATGATPAGALDFEGDLEVFVDDMMAEQAALFINARDTKPLHPVATAYMAENHEREACVERLVRRYLEVKQRPVGLPADHLKVQLEFLLLLIDGEEGDAARDFYLEFMKEWTERFAAAIVARKPSRLFLQVAELVRGLAYL